MNILIVRLPCKKIYPLGPIYLMSLLRRANPSLGLRLLDLALIEPARMMPTLEAVIAEDRPDLIAFSWRDLQQFSPQDPDGGLRTAFTFFHDPSPARKLRAALQGLRNIFTYHASLARNLRIIRETASAHPHIACALGGPSVKIFGDRLGARIPARVRVFNEVDVDTFFAFLGLSMPLDAIEPAIDLDFLQTAFPQWEAYRGEVIGVQTKRGCPQACVYCLYGELEGRTVRRRDPVKVVSEIKAYARHWGVRRFWFADAQLLSEPADETHLRSILEGIIEAGLGIEWSGYLRIDKIDHSLASLMTRSGLCELEVSLGSGSQDVVDALRLGFSVDNVIKGLTILRSAGYSGRVLLNLSLNAPGETRETLLATMAVVRRLTSLLGDDRVVPVVFFLAIQPRTGLEARALADGHIAKGYNPLSVLPWNVLRLIYNPPPLGALIGRSCARVFRDGQSEAGERILAAIEKELCIESV